MPEAGGPGQRSGARPRARRSRARRTSIRRRFLQEQRPHHTPSRALVRAGVHGADRRLAPRIAAGCAWLGVQFMAYASRGLRLHGGPAFRRKEMNSQLSDGLVGTRRRSVELASRSASGGRSSGDACCGSQLRAGNRRPRCLHDGDGRRGKAMPTAERLANADPGKYRPPPRSSQPFDRSCTVQIGRFF